MDKYGKMRDPTKREISCCSTHNDRAFELNNGNAQVQLILGDIAASQLLGEGFKKNRLIFWHKTWGCYVIRSKHPAYFVRGGMYGMNYYTWRDRFRAVAAVLKYPGEWGYLKAQKYTTVRTHAEFDAMEKHLRAEAKAGRRVSFDIEDDVITDNRHRLLLAGFGTGRFLPREEDPTSPMRYFVGRANGSGYPDHIWRGRCYSVVLDHPESGYEPTHLKELQERVKKLVEDGTIKKSLQSGTYDKSAVKATIEATLRGYDYDTQYGSYLRYSFLRSCSLEHLSNLFFPEFCNYKAIVEPWEGDKKRDIKAHFANAPLDLLILRNCGDCDVTQRLEQRFSEKARVKSGVKQALVEIYIHAAQTLRYMEGRGPLLDWPNWEEANKALPAMVKKLNKELLLATGLHKFEATSSQQVAKYIYDTLKLPETEAGRTTNKTVLEYLQATCNNPRASKLIGRINRRRAVGKLQNTYLEGFKKSAEEHNDELHTIWWLTGTVTGRLRSGKGDEAERKGILNMQNLANNPLLQNLVVSDKNWRKALGNSKQRTGS